MSTWLVRVLAPLIVASACHPTTQGNAAANGAGQKHSIRDGVELAAEVFNAEDRQYLKALGALSSQVKSGDPVAEQAYAELILWWHKRPYDQGEPSASLTQAWDLYRRAATKSQSAFSWLRAYYANGEPGLPSNQAVAKCMLNVTLQRLPLSEANRCYGIKSET